MEETGIITKISWAFLIGLVIFTAYEIYDRDQTYESVRDVVEGAYQARYGLTLGLTAKENGTSYVHKVAKDTWTVCCDGPHFEAVTARVKRINGNFVLVYLHRE